MHVLKSTLLHTALAYSSPEMAAMDSVIRNAHRQQAPVLPTEILLLVRESLLPQVAAQLIRRSTHALVAYERSLRALLCADCISYNHDIYGPDVWQWDQFNGACACVESAETISLMFGSRSSCAKQPPRTQQVRAGNPHPKQYTDSSDWLEAYLSREASLLVTPSPSEAGSMRAAPDIWTLVSTMLRDYDCEALWDPEEAARARSHNRIVRRQFHFLRDTIPISALPHRDEATRGPEAASLEPGDRQRTQIIARGVRELGLALAYAEEYGAYVPYVPPVMHLRSWPGASNACYRGQELVDVVKELARTVLSLALGCLSVPITFAAVAVRIFCYYSRPRGFRLL